MNNTAENIIYRLRVLDVDVHEWGKDGEGDYVCTKGGYIIGEYPTKERVKLELNEYFGYELSAEDADANYIFASQIEDDDGYQNKRGKYIASYTLIVERIEPVSMFNEVAACQNMIDPCHELKAKLTEIEASLKRLDDGYQNKRGKYIASYTLIVERIEPVSMFNEVAA